MFQCTSLLCHNFQTYSIWCLSALRFYTLSFRFTPISVPFARFTWYTTNTRAISARCFVQMDDIKFSFWQQFAVGLKVKEQHTNTHLEMIKPVLFCPELADSNINILYHVSMRGRQTVAFHALVNYFWPSIQPISCHQGRDCNEVKHPD